jgi:hypothetical protein
MVALDRMLVWDPDVRLAGTPRNSRDARIILWKDTAGSQAIHRGTEKARRDYPASMSRSSRVRTSGCAG